MKTIYYLTFLLIALAFGVSLQAAQSLQYSTSTFTESPENDGTIDNTIVITYSNTTGDSFKGYLGDDFVALGKVSVTNLPAGLTARILKTGDLTLVPVLTGTATSHNNANDISNLTFTFQNSAFISNYAASSGGSELAVNSVITNGTIYYASQAINGVESSSRLAVTASIDETPCTPTGATTHSFSVGTTVANLVVTGNNIRWYTTANGGTYLDTSVVLTSGTYYATQTLNCTESTNRFEVAVIIN